MPTSTDLVTDLPADFEVFGQAVATSMADLLGGTTGQILAKATNADMDFTWVTNDVGDITAVTAGTGISGGGTSGAVTITNDMATTITASGDIVVGTGSGTYDNLPIGTTGQILTADTTVSPYKVKWAAAPASSPLTTKGDLYTYSTADARLAVGANYGFLTADSTAATGNKWNDGAWTTYTPTIASSSGTLTTASAEGRYIRVGKLCTVVAKGTITTNGSGAGVILMSLPFTAEMTVTGTIALGIGREIAVAGFPLSVIRHNSTNMQIRDLVSDGYPGSSGAVLTVIINYEVA
jgi:hypothetical protein